MRQTRSRYRLVVFDVDGTVTRHVSSWRFIHERLGLWDALAHRYQARFLSGKITYREFCDLDAAHWRGMGVTEMQRIFREIPYSKNVVPCIRHLRERGLKLAAVSTGIQFITDRIRDELGFDYVLGNRLLARNGVLTGKVKINVSHGGKGRVLAVLTRRFRVRPQEIVCVGDSDGDVPLALKCGYSIAFNCTSDSLRRAADYRCRTRDFNEIRDVIDRITIPPVDYAPPGSRRK